MNTITIWRLTFILLLFDFCLFRRSTLTVITSTINTFPSLLFRWTAFTISIILFPTIAVYALTALALTELILSRKRLINIAFKNRTRSKICNLSLLWVIKCSLDMVEFLIFFLVIPFSTPIITTLSSRIIEVSILAGFLRIDSIVCFVLPYLCLFLALSLTIMTVFIHSESRWVESWTTSYFRRQWLCLAEYLRVIVGGYKPFSYIFNVVKSTFLEFILGAILAMHNESYIKYQSLILLLLINQEISSKMLQRRHQY